MTHEEYLESLQKKFETHFKVERNVMLLGERIDIHASFSNVSGRTFITPNDVIDKCESYEYCYVKKTDRVTEDEIDAFGQFLKRIVDEYVEPGRDHMSTYVTGVIIGNSIDDKAGMAIKVHRFSRAYSFYLRGWCDVRLIGIGLDDNQIITNKAGKRVQKVYQIAP
ncbi:MAG: uncharacterized protein K0R84_886 [Clostridia bacterium]|jgi:hypothetical protein|nr:uncharacterized protein [Clostridia bacterium]